MTQNFLLLNSDKTEVVAFGPLISYIYSYGVSWCYGACCPLFPVLSAPSWSRQMAALPGSGSHGGFFLLKGSFFFPQSPRAAQDVGLDQREV